MTPSPSHLRVVIVNYNGYPLLARAVGSVRSSNWDGELDIVVVDNASTDESLASIEGVAGVSVIRRDTNEGFGANNHALADLLGAEPVLDLSEPEYVALLNPDALVHESTLSALAGAVDPERHIGAAAPHIIFDRPYVELATVQGDVTVRRVEMGGNNVTAQCHSTGRAFRLPGRRNPLWRCPEGSTLRVPAPRIGDELRVTFDRRSAGTFAGHRIDGSGSATFDAAALRTVKVVQNAGSELDRRGFGHNRGFGAVDGQRRFHASVPAWCGAAVLFHSDYLRDVGGFEPSFFLYYEDADLALRGVARGWSTIYVADAVVEHRHSDRASQGTELVEVLQHRNRLLMLARNAPLSMVVRALFGALATPASLLVSALREPGLAGPRLRLARWRLKSVAQALGRLPAAVASRRTLGRGRSVRPKRVMLSARG